MSKTEYELQTIKIALKKIDELKHYSIIDNSERPDCIIMNNNNKIGLEHVLIDTNLNNEKWFIYLSRNKQFRPPIATSREIERKKSNIFYNYEDIADIDYNEVKKRIEDVINSHLKYTFEFNETSFCIAFKHGVCKHAMKVDDYRKRVGKYYKIGLVCEIPLPFTEYDWDVSYDGKKYHRQRIVGIPITKCIKKILLQSISSGEKKGFDFIILVTRNIYTNKSSADLYRIKDLLSIREYSNFRPHQYKLKPEVSILIKKH